MPCKLARLIQIAVPMAQGFRLNCARDVAEQAVLEIDT